MFHLIVTVEIKGMGMRGSKLIADLSQAGEILVVCTLAHVKIWRA
jgi:hypothetical protein